MNKKNYAIVKQQDGGTTEVAYAESFEEAIQLRDHLVIDAAYQFSRLEKWYVYREVEDMAKSKFWRWLTKLSDWAERKANED